MRILFATQGESLNLFNAVRREVGLHIPIESAGFTLSDSASYLKFLEAHHRFENEDFHLLKEWELTACRHDEPDLTLLREYEDKIGAEPGLFGAIVGDRRLFMGINCTFSQDYRRRFSDKELLSILQEALKRTEVLFDTLRPDLVVSFICVTFLDYLVFLFAKARGIRFLNIRPTRVGDRITLGSTLNDPSPEFMQSYEKCLSSGSDNMNAARSYLEDVRIKHAKYEGVVKPSAKPALKVSWTKRGPFHLLTHLIKTYANYKKSIAASDNHVANPIRALFYSALINPYRAKRTFYYLRKRYIQTAEFGERRFVFFPMHTEPEVSLLVYGRPFVNQIEIIRQIAISLPVDMILVVKEHPWMVGKRSRGAYDKLLNIPRVHLVDPSTNARELIRLSSLVTVITGSVALEAVMLGKPVLTFGDGPFNALPDTMVKRCSDLRRLPEDISNLIDPSNGDNNDKYLEAYLAAVFENSESINLYSNLLMKKNVYQIRESDYQLEVKKLANYLLECLKVEPEDTASVNGSARW